MVHLVDVHGGKKKQKYSNIPKKFCLFFASKRRLSRMLFSILLFYILWEQSLQKALDDWMFVSEIGT